MTDINKIGAADVVIDARAVTLSGTLMPADLPPLHAVRTRRHAPDLGLPATMPDPDDRPITRESLGDRAENALNAIIEDCHYLMREVAWRGIVQAADTDERLAFLNTALKCAETSARTAKAVARLRAFPLDEDRKDAVLVEVDRLMARRSKKNVPNPENNGQDVAP
jgi:hypothetical protein